jgi:hypothetical protein
MIFPDYENLSRIGFGVTSGLFFDTLVLAFPNSGVFACGARII